MTLPVSAVIAGLCALWMFYLQVRVIGFRRGQGVSLGHADDVMGERLIRAHGNAAENIPIFLILFALSEAIGTPPWVLWLIGASFIAGRLAHGIHFFKIRKGGNLRVFGMIATFTPIIVLSIGLVGHGIASL